MPSLKSHAAEWHFQSLSELLRQQYSSHPFRPNHQGFYEQHISLRHSPLLLRNRFHYAMKNELYHLVSTLFHPYYPLHNAWPVLTYCLLNNGLLTVHPEFALYHSQTTARVSQIWVSLPFLACIHPTDGRIEPAYHTLPCRYMLL